MPEVTVDIGGNDQPLRIAINGSNPTFQVRTDPIAAKAMTELDTRLLDLVDIAVAVFAADCSLSRGGATRPNMGSNWRRQMALTVPVRNPELWSQDGVRSALIDAVEFLTEDRVDFTFEAAVEQPLPQRFLDLDPTGATFDAEEVILFSGGLDSFAGALEALSRSASKVILVTHRSAQKAIPRQVELGRYLSDRFNGRVLHIHVLARRTGEQAHDSTQRSRAFLFAALGQLVARTFNARKLSFYENGTVSHNLPLSPQIVGTMATRTTHPLTLTRFNALFDMVGPDLVQIENRYQWLTKTEVVRRIAENDGADQIAKSVSCTSIREQTVLHTHCGACSQCLDRRFATIEAGLEKNDFVTDYKTDVLFGERPDLRSRTLSVEWTRHALHLGRLDERRLMASFGLEIARIVRGHPELTSQETIRRTLDMHRRHAETVTGVLESAVRDNAPALVNQSLPATSLLALMLTGTSLAEKTLSPESVPMDMPGQNIEDSEEVDIVPDPAAPLRVSFFQEDGHDIVAVDGLGRVAGQPARIPHALKPTFDEDQNGGLESDEYRYIPLTRIPEISDLNKDQLRQYVARCRKVLATNFEDIFGYPPKQHLLLQNKISKGYRLDPTIIVNDSNR